LFVEVRNREASNEVRTYDTELSRANLK
jgi:hypothetical protein